MMAHHTEISHINAENSMVGVFNCNKDADLSLDKLPYAPRAAFNSGPSTEDEPGWREGTRSEIIQRIHEWIASDSGHILWLNGWAGCGKSTIASMISERCSGEGTAWFASFFFSKDRDTTTGTNFVGTIVQQLAQQRPSLKESLKAASREFRKALKNVLDGYGQIIEKEIVYQWDTLLVRPVSGLKCAEGSTRLVIVIDALDECLKEADIGSIIHLLGNLHVMGQIRPKVLVTSRPESNIKKRFLEIGLNTHRSIVLHNEPPERIERDIQRFISRRLNSLKLTDSELRLLTERASGLFIWISIACRQILLRKTTDLQREMLERLLRLENQTDSEMHMNRLYTTILANSVENGEDNYSQHDSTKSCEQFRKILGSLVALRSPLSVNSLETLLQLRAGTVQDALKPLHSIVEMPSKPSLLIRLHHPSFDNYLFDEKRCMDKRFFVQSQRAHRLLADSCFVAMNIHLREDICGKKRPGTSTKEIDSVSLKEQIPPFLQYSCISWTQHTSMSQYQMLDGGTVHEFFKQHFLHWFEVLSWMGEVLEGIKMLTHLESYIAAQQSPELHALVCDAKRFAIYGRTIAEESPLQIYSSLLLFTPSHGPIHQTFQCTSPWLKQSGKCEIKPTPLLHSLECATAGWIADVALSNKDTLATLTQEGSIEIWDLNIGAVTQILSGDPITDQERKKAHPWDRNLRLIRFSPDGTKLAIVRNGSISVWDLNTNTRTLGSDDKTVYTQEERPTKRWVGFCQSPKWLAIGTDESGIYSWDLETTTGPVLIVPAPIIRFVDFYHAKELQISDWPISTSIDTDYKCFSSSYNAFEWNLEFSCSDNGKVVAITSNSVGIVFEVTTKDLIYFEPLKDSLQQFQVFTISPDGSSLIKQRRMLDLPYVVDVRTGNRTILRVENEKGLKDIVILNGSPSFSLCSKNMAVGGPGCVSLIDLENMEQKYNKGRHISDILGIIFGNRPLGTPSFKCRNIPSKILPDILEFSPNGQRLAATVERHVVNIWDVNGSPVLDRGLQPRDRLYEDIYFSKNGEIVVATEGEILEVFRVTDGRSIYETYLDPLSGYSCLAFVKDYKILALTCSFREEVGPLLVDFTTGRTTEVSEEDIELIHLSRHLAFGKHRGECSKATIGVEYALHKYFGHSPQPRPSDKAKESTMELDTGQFCLMSAESPGNLLYAARFLDPGYSGIWIYHLPSKKVLGTIGVDKCLYVLSFIDDTTLYTNLGIFRIDFSGAHLASQASITKIVEITDRWIILRGKKALQIPAEYRRRVMASRSPVSKDIVAISKPYGGLMFIEFDFSKLPK